MGVAALWFFGLLVVIIDIAATVDVIRRPDLGGADGRIPLRSAPSPVAGRVNAVPFDARTGGSCATLATADRRGRR